MKKKLISIIAVSALAATVLSANEVLKDTSLTLQKSIDIALKSNTKNQISKHSLEIAKAQYAQAMSANYPALTLEGAAIKRDENLINIMKGDIELPQDMSNILALASAANEIERQMIQQAIAMGMIPKQSLSMNLETIVMGRNTIAGSLKMNYPLYTGGKISSIVKQAELGTKIAQEDIKRTEQEVVFDVRKYYYGSVLSKQVVQLLSDTTEQMEFLEELTEELYKGGSENVKKTDYLRIKLTVSMIKGMLEDLKAKEKLAKSALINAMGIDYQSEITLADTEIKNSQLTDNINHFVNTVYQSNPDLSKVNIALDIYDAKIDEAKSDYLPNIALMGSVDYVHNNYDGGMSNDTNENSWSVGIGVQYPLFEGFRTKNKVIEAKVNKKKLETQKKMLKDGLALQVKQAFLETVRSQNQVNILKTALKTAAENRDLNTRAYQEDMVETKDVIEAQIMEARVKGEYFKAMHDQALNLANLELIVGKEIRDNK